MCVPASPIKPSQLASLGHSPLTLAPSTLSPLHTLAAFLNADTDSHSPVRFFFLISTLASDSQDSQSRLTATGPHSPPVSSAFSNVKISTVIDCEIETVFASRQKKKEEETVRHRAVSGHFHFHWHRLTAER